MFINTDFYFKLHQNNSIKANIYLIIIEWNDIKLQTFDPGN